MIDNNTYNFQYFLSAFEAVLSLEASRRNEVNVAVTGIGLISSLCKNSAKFESVADKVFDNAEKISQEYVKYFKWVEAVVKFLVCF